MDLISVGYSANDGAGDTLRQAGIKINTNFQNIDTEFVKKEDLGEPGNPPLINSSGNLEALVSHRGRWLNGGTDPNIIPNKGEIMIHYADSGHNYPAGLSVGNGEYINGRSFGLMVAPLFTEISAELSTDPVYLPTSLPIIPLSGTGGILVNFCATLFFSNDSFDAGAFSTSFVHANVMVASGSIEPPTVFSPCVPTIISSGIPVIIPPSSIVNIIIPLQSSVSSPIDMNNGQTFFNFRKMTHVDTYGKITLSTSSIGDQLYAIFPPPEGEE
jgi:hypothetical protein